MSEELKGCTVVFEKDIDKEYAQHILNAIKMIKGVLSVEGVIATYDDYYAKERVYMEVRKKLLAVVYPEWALKMAGDMEGEG